MRILMIGLGDGILKNPLADERERHVEYAKRAGALDMIVYSPRSRGLKKSRLTPELTVYPSRSSSRLNFVSDAFRIGCQILDRSKADLITTQDPFSTGLAGYLLKRRYGIPLQVQNHSCSFKNRVWITERPCRNRLFDILGKFIIRRADALRVVNREEAAKYPALGVPKERVQVIVVPVNLTRFNTLPGNGALLKLRKQLGLGLNERVVLWVGRPVACKRLNLWLKTLKLVREKRPEVRGVVVGDLSFDPKLPETANRLGLGDGVIFPGSVKHEQLPAYFALAEVYLHTSIYEGLGRVMVEAGAAGRPVVTTPTNGGLEVVLPEKTGIISDEDPRALANSVLRLLDDTELKKRMGEAARNWIHQRFDREKNIADIVAAWRNIVEYKESS